ncbi:M10 family metallopeptidase C-terminal domain-containing protein [Niveispirillum sp.]|uniref:M10 family metallopeptidase C-terminal domain-containing protein n=1 Tax=Niveispirillum sp. TaxID=1917217 RepID=UPI001B505A66|nr:M10 family metallopeptidase C-terminal domain-containing protein [Niveispirillum sp.]MBP7337127.1 M10 family metallopeptidase C-terminal domain-containing protein [Niveispirillum sp.]
MATFNGTSGNDSLTGSTSADMINGGDGADTLLGGSGEDTIAGDAGDDRLVGGNGSDMLTGGSGNDVFVLERLTNYSSNNDLITDFAKGQDRIDVSGLGINSLTTLLTLTRAQQATDGSQQTVITTNYNGDANTLTFGANQTLLVSSDFIFAANNGPQSLSGTNSADDLFGGAGNDTLTGGSGADRLFGDAGDDRLVGGNGNDTFFGGGGNDVFVLDRMNDYSRNVNVIADFAKGQDRIDVSGLGINSLATLLALTTAQQAADGSQLTTISTNYSGDTNSLTFGANQTLLVSSDFIFANNSAAQNLTGTNYSDDLFGGAGNDTILGGNGDDRLFGDAGNDRLIGGNGNDTFTGGAGNDVFVLDRQTDYSRNYNTITDFTQGQDRIDVSGLGINSMDTLLALTDAEQAADGTQLSTISTDYSGDTNTLTFAVNVTLLTSNDFIFASNNSPQNLTGTAYADHLFGGSANDTVVGGNGDDALFGDAGDDRLVGGNGSDVLFGGAGKDVFVFERRGDYSTNSDIIADFTQGQDRLDVSGLGISSLTTLLELASALQAPDGSAVTRLETRYNGDTNIMDMLVARPRLTSSDFIFASQTAAITLTGTSYHDDLFGGGGADTLAGANGYDRLFGDAGDDRLVGGAGNDTLYGGLGQDTAVFTGARANYQITTANGATIVRDLGNTEGTDTLYGVETLLFNDTSVTVQSAPVPVLTLTGSRVLEGNAGTTTLIFTASLSSASDSPVTFVSTVRSGTATSGIDYIQPDPQSVTIAAGSRTATIKVVVQGDTRVEGHETVTLMASNLANATLEGNVGGVTAVSTIVNDDFQSSFTLAAYRALNPDLVSVFGANDAAYVSHYATNGRYEGRASSGFDADAYAAMNPDLFRYFGLDATALANHYQGWGKAEGRLATGFDADAYAALNPDLFAAFGLNKGALISHYVSNGRAEGRLAVGFDAEAYAALNPDLFRIFGLNTSQLVDHYIHNGRAEGRLAVGFDAETYAALNPDLLGVFGLNHNALISHYISNGRAEGRLAYNADGIAATSALDLVGVPATNGDFAA